jgi:ribonuclease E
MGQSQSHVESSESAPPVEAVIPATVDEVILTPASPASPASLASPVEEAPVEETSAPPASPVTPAAEAPVEETSAPPASPASPAVEAPVEAPASPVSPVEAPASPSPDNTTSVISSIQKIIASYISSGQEVTVHEVPVTEAPIQEAPVKETVPASGPPRKITLKVRMTPVSYTISRASDRLRLEE